MIAIIFLFSAIAGGKYILYDAFPINMSEIALQYAQNDIIEEFTVTFQYQRYENVGIDVSV